MKKYIKNERGITLIILIVTVIIIAILTGVIVKKMDTGKDIRNYNYMCADIELLKNKVLAYYNENGSAPTKGTAFNAKTTLGTQASSRDSDNYYEIDLNKLYNITLNYGGGSRENGDIYIVNEQSLEVYYLKGMVYENKSCYKPMGMREQPTTAEEDKSDEEEQIKVLAGPHQWKRGTGTNIDKITCELCSAEYTIGQEVNYAPTQHEAVTVSDKTVEQETDLRWVVLGIEDNNNDSVNETLLIVSDKPTTAKINVDKDTLNQTCKDLYSNTNLAVNARGMTIDDVNTLVGYIPTGGYVGDDATGSIYYKSSGFKTLREWGIASYGPYLGVEDISEDDLDTVMNCYAFELSRSNFK